jgi:hypothetical protein
MVHLPKGGDAGPPRIGPNAIGITYVNGFCSLVIFAIVEPALLGVIFLPCPIFDPFRVNALK